MDPDQRWTNMVKSSFAMDYKLGKPLSKDSRDRSTRQFSILENLNKAGFEPEDCVQLLEMNTNLFDFLKKR